MAGRRKGAKGRRKGGNGRRKMRMYKGPKQQQATITQLIEVDSLKANSITSFENFSLKAFDRAAGVARYYQFYRMKYCKITFKPLYDTWTQPNALPGGSVPYLYYLIDNGYSFNPQFCSSFNSMRDAGAKPIRLDDRSIVVHFKPAVAVNVGDVQAGSTSTTPFSMVRKSPWLTTNANASSTTAAPWSPNGTDHRGIWFGVEQDVLQAGQDPVPYMVSIEAHFEFKKPLSFANPSTSLVHQLVDLEDPNNIKQN